MTDGTGNRRPAEPSGENPTTTDGVATAGTPSVDPTSSAWPPVRRLGGGGRYHLEERIATGGAATVWRAYDEQLDRSVAIKILHPHLVNHEDTVLRFERESRNAARLHHPNAIRIFDSGRINDVVYLVMEYVDGPTLKDILREHGALGSWAVVAAIGEQIATALAEAHAQGLVHRDIKPANILFTSDGIVKVVDFGIAKALTSSTSELTAEGTTVGTATYIAPEQYTGDDVDARVDIYSLGMVLYECLTGRPAFLGDTPTATAAARLTREVVPPRQVRADVDRRLEDVVVRCTRRDPDERFSDVSAVAHALRAMVADAEPHELTRELVAAAPPEEPARPQFPDADPNAITDPSMPSGGRTRLRVAAAFLAGMALAALAVFWLTRDDDAPGPSPFEGGDPVTISAARDYDPQDDNQENPDDVRRAFDEVLTTAWTTNTYPAASGLPFGGNKTGVGVYFDLGNAEINTIILNSLQPGQSVSVYVADEVPDEVDNLVGWGPPVARFEDLAREATLEFDAPVSGRYWLLWLTRIPEVEPGTQQGSIAEIRFYGETLEPVDEGAP